MSETRYTKDEAVRIAERHGRVSPILLMIDSREIGLEEGIDAVNEYVERRYKRRHRANLWAIVALMIFV